MFKGLPIDHIPLPGDRSQSSPKIIAEFLKNQSMWGLRAAIPS